MIDRAIPSWVSPLLALSVLAATALAAFFHGMSVKQGEWDAAVVAEQQGQKRALDAAAAAIARIEVTSEQIIQPLRTEIRTNTVYRDCRHSDDSLRNLNALIVGRPAGESKLPRADSAD